MGNRHIRLPLSAPSFHKQLHEVVAMAVNTKTAALAVGGNELLLEDLSPLGWDLRLFLPAGGPVYSFVLEQYSQPQHGIRVQEGDYVIDCVGCWGDTALYFAQLAGQTGRVSSLEFMKENLKVFRKNLYLNPLLKTRVEIVKHPVWSRSGVPMLFASSGP